MAITKVTNSLVATNAIQGTLIADNAITSVHIAQNQVTSVQIPDSSITSTQLAANSVDTAELISGSIDAIHLASDSVTTAKILDANVTTAKIANNAITSALIPDGSITDTQLGSGAFTMGNITTTGAIRGPASLTIDPATVGDNTGTVVIAGNLQVDGTTTTVNSTTLDVVDKNITLGKGGSASANNGGGITIDGAAATMLYTHATTSFDFNKPVNVTGNIISTGNILAGTTNSGLSSSSSATGINLIPDGATAFVRDGGAVMYLNRLTSDGPIMQLRKAGATIGVLGTIDSDLIVYSTASGHKGLRFGNGYIAATNNAGTIENGTTDIGLSSQKFKNLHLSGTISSGTISSGAITASADISVVKSNNAKLIVNSVGDYFPSLEIKRTSASSKTNYAWNFQIGSSGFLNLIDGTNSYYAAIFKNNGDIALSNDTDSTNPVLLLDKSASSATFAGTISSGAITSSGHIITNTSSRIENQRISMEADGTLDWGSSKQYGTLTWDTNKAIVVAQAGSSLEFRTNNTGVALQIDTSQNSTFLGEVSTTNAKLKAIAESNTDTAVDVFVYDTRKDSDGGAWRKRTQNTSWYNETLNTSTRGARKEFPSVAVIVIASNNVIIYDGDDPDMPMWMVFPSTGSVSWATGGTSTLNSTVALNGIVVISSGVNSGGGMGQYNFAKDDISISYNSSLYSLNDRKISTGRLAKSYSTVSSGGGYPLINSAINDIAVTVLPNAPIDADTGLPVPTIAVATNGGVSVIKDSGSVVDITNGQDSSAFNYIDNLFFRKDGALVWVGDSSTNTAAERFLQVLHNLPNADINQGTVENSSVIDEQYGPSHKTGSKLRWATTAGVKATSDAGENFAVGTSGALHLIKYNREVEQEGSIAHITSDYNTGYMLGDIKLATLSDTSTTNVTGGTQPDRSYNNNALNVTGTVTKTAVATGADLVGYSGFSASNYLQQPNNSDFEFGTDDWSMMGWITQTGSASTQHPIQLGLTTGSSSEISILRQTSSVATLLGFRVRGDTGSYAANPAGGLINTNVWTHFVLTKSGSQLLWYINGELIHSVASSNVGNIGFSSSDVLRIGHGTSTVTADVMKLALLRISATAPTAEQIAKMYNDEKHLFATNAKATLYGTSDAVTALAYDDSTELLHVGTSAGRSEFQGLNRVNNTTDAVGTAISASNGLVAED